MLVRICYHCATSNRFVVTKSFVSHPPMKGKVQVNLSYMNLSPPWFQEVPLVLFPTTTLSGTNMLPLYNSSVCVLTEAPSNANERYTAEDIKAFADAGWKTAEEKYVAKRGVKRQFFKALVFKPSLHHCLLIVHDQGEWSSLYQKNVMMVV